MSLILFKVMHIPSHKKEGFTLIELLLVIAIIAILASIVIIAINPARQLAQANNAKQRADVNTALDAVYQYTIDNGGTFPASIPTTSTEICRSGVSTSTCSPGVDLGTLTADQLYLVGIPTDPSALTATGTGYFISKSTSTNPRITVRAPGAELGETIEVTR